MLNFMQMLKLGAPAPEAKAPPTGVQQQGDPAAMEFLGILALMQQSLGGPAQAELGSAVPAPGSNPDALDPKTARPGGPTLLARAIVTASAEDASKESDTAPQTPLESSAEEPQEILAAASNESEIPIKPSESTPTSQADAVVVDPTPTLTAKGVHENEPAKTPQSALNEENKDSEDAGSPNAEAPGGLIEVSALAKAQTAVQPSTPTQAQMPVHAASLRTEPLDPSVPTPRAATSKRLGQSVQKKADAFIAPASSSSTAAKKARPAIVSEDGPSSASATDEASTPHSPSQAPAPVRASKAGPLQARDVQPASVVDSGAIAPRAPEASRSNKAQSQALSSRPSTSDSATRLATALPTPAVKPPLSPDNARGLAPLMPPSDDAARSGHALPSRDPALPAPTTFTAPTLAGETRTHPSRPDAPASLRDLAPSDAPTQEQAVPSKAEPTLSVIRSSGAGPLPLLDPTRHFSNLASDLASNQMSNQASFRAAPALARDVNNTQNKSPRVKRGNMDSMLMVHAPSPRSQARACAASGGTENLLTPFSCSDSQPKLLRQGMRNTLPQPPRGANPRSRTPSVQAPPSQSFSIELPSAPKHDPSCDQSCSPLPLEGEQAPSASLGQKETPDSGFHAPAERSLTPAEPSNHTASSRSAQPSLSTTHQVVQRIQDAMQVKVTPHDLRWQDPNFGELHLRIEGRGEDLEISIRSAVHQTHDTLRLHHAAIAQELDLNPSQLRFERDEGGRDLGGQTQEQTQDSRQDNGQDNRQDKTRSSQADAGLGPRHPRPSAQPGPTPNRAQGASSTGVDLIA